MLDLKQKYASTRGLKTAGKVLVAMGSDGGGG